jgi:hypothetical protein
LRADVERRPEVLEDDVLPQVFQTHPLQFGQDAFPEFGIILAREVARMTSSWTNWLEPTAIVLAAGPTKGRMGVAPAFTWLLVLLLTQSVSLTAQMTNTDTANQAGTTLAITAQAGLGNPKQELIARFGSQTRVLTALTNLLAESGLPWHITAVAAPLQAQEVEIANLDKAIEDLQDLLVLIAEEIRSRDPGDPEYAAMLADLMASQAMAGARLAQTQAQRADAFVERDATGRTNAVRVRGFFLPTREPEMRLWAQPNGQDHWLLVEQWTPGSHWRTEEATHLVDWVESRFGYDGHPLATNLHQDLLGVDNIAPRRYFRARLLPW